MSRMQTVGVWVSRVALVAATVIFSAIGLRFVLDPVHASAAAGVAVPAGWAATTTRVGSGAFPLAIAFFSLACLFSRSKLRLGAGLVGVVAATAIVVRLVGLVVDGPSAESTRLFAPEMLLLLLALTGAVMQRNARDTAALPEPRGPV